MNGLTNQQLESLQRALEEALAQLETAPSKRSEIEAERSGDDADEAQRQEAVALAVHTIDSLRERSLAIKAALDRIENGDYGLCLECEEPIHPKRLAAAPWAARCLRCQSEAEARDGSNRYRSAA